MPQYLVKKVTEFFKQKSLEQIDTPNFELYESFWSYDEKTKASMIKTIDTQNRVLVLRPDMTIPVAKFAAKVEQEEMQLFYSTTIFREYRGLKRSGKDFLQCGAELYSKNDPTTDCMSLALESLQACGLENLMINLSNVKFFEEIIKEMALTMWERDYLLELIEKRNRTEIKKYLDSIDRPSEKILCALRLYGHPEDVLEQAEQISNANMKKALESLQNSVSSIREKFPDVVVNVDLGRATPLNYYNATYFEIYAKSYHVAIVGGGRYDDLMRNFGSQKKACGYGINMALLEEALNYNGSQKLKIAVAKGRIEKECMKRLQNDELSFPEYDAKTRKLIFTSEDDEVEIILVKTSDVATYVENGTCDIGVVGSDVLEETPYDVVELENLDFGICRMSVAALRGTTLDENDLTIASKYPNIAKKYFSAKGITPNIIKLNGSVELGPIVGLSDAIVDIVESGNTLRENGLEERESFMDISSRLVANKFSFINKKEKIDRVIRMLKGWKNEKN